MRCQVCIRVDFNTGRVYAVTSVKLPPLNFEMQSPVIYDHPEKSAACWPQGQNHFWGEWRMP